MNLIPQIVKWNNSTRRSFFLISLVLVMLILIIYGQTYQFGTAMDESFAIKYFSLNPTWDDHKIILTALPYAIPVSLFFSYIDSKFFGDQTGPRHLVNVFFHICITLIFFVTFSSATGEIYKSGFLAALYAVHPINVESVAWIASHETVLSIFFSASALLVYTKYTFAPDRKKKILVFILFILGLLSQYRIIMFPFLLILFDYWPLKRLAFRNKKIAFAVVNKGQITLWQSLKEKVSLLAVSCLWVLGLYYYYIHTTYSINGDPSKTGFVHLIQRLDIMTSYVGYMFKLFFPLGLVHDHCLDIYHRMSICSWVLKLIGSALILVLICRLVFKETCKGNRFYMAGWLWFLVAMLPAVWINSSTHHLIADRYAALGTIGIFAAFTWGGAKLAEKRHYEGIFHIAGMLLVIILTYLSHTQVQYWRNEITVFKHAADVRPGNQMPSKVLGELFLQQGKLEAALQAYQRAISLGPEDTDIYNQMGVAYLRQKKRAAALCSFNKAIDLMTDNIEAYHNKALIDYNKDDEVEPYFSNTHFSWHIAMSRPPAEAIQDVYKNLGSTLFHKGKIEEALHVYRQALVIGPANADIYNKMGEVYLSQKNTGKALRCFNQAIECGPGYGYAMAHHNIGNVLLDMGEVDRAIFYFEKALQIEPYFFMTHNSLATAFLHKKQTDNAIYHLEVALKINPDYTSARHNFNLIRHACGNGIPAPRRN
jgi:tetratricopeptide (TPR) repeat protein